MSIRSEIDRISVAKSAIKSAIEESGVAVPDGTKLDGYPALTSGILGQFSDELDTIIGGDTTPVTDVTARLSAVNGISGDVTQQLDTLDGTKTAIHDAIVAKGVDIPDGTVFRDYAAKIGEIDTGSSTLSVVGSGSITGLPYQKAFELDTTALILVVIYNYNDSIGIANRGETAISGSIKVELSLDGTSVTRTSMPAGGGSTTANKWVALG